jgi:hypothetical protein
LAEPLKRALVFSADRRLAVRHEPLARLAEHVREQQQRVGTP